MRFGRGAMKETRRAAVTVVCPRCRAENQFAGPLSRKSVYRCTSCQAKLDRVSDVNYWLFASLVFFGWFLAPVPCWLLFWGVESERIENNIGALIYFMLAIDIGILLVTSAVVLSVICLWDGLRHRSCAGALPQRFWVFPLASAVGICACGLEIFAMTSGAVW